MPSICFYFQVHQPYRMRHYHLFEIGSSQDYFDDKKNREVCRKVADKCYLPANALMLELINRYPGQFKVSYSISGVVLEQFEQYAPEVLESFKRLVATGQVELLSETYYHSLAALFQGDEFREQIKIHQQTIRHHFGVTPTVFRNTELIYSDGIADMVEDLGFQAMVTEGADRILGWRSPNFVYEPAHGRGMKLLLKNYKLSDDIAFRFSQQSWAEWPLTTEKFARWLHSIDGSGDTINLFMDYETIGEHQWESTGIFNFFRALPEAVLRHPQFDFATPSEVIRAYPPVDKVSIPDAISWADTERDLSAWLGNPMQDGSISWLYSMDQAIKESGDQQLLHQWRKLQTSDHFYYMCTKYWSDGDVHKYFSVYDAPHDSYVIMSNVLTDLEIRLKKLPKKTDPVAKKLVRLG
ncbi:glycoside hydrolase family 57 protein [Patescibacteria group bacterium]|nr:glycoside hydrolase family 57 protein [Patescibacteria group bacterium]